jgi:uncharacterized phage protein gp47/JayE
MTYGLTDTGFIKKRQPDIQLELEADFRAVFGIEINLLATSIYGQLIGSLSEREALIWELLEEIYNSAFPDTASGASLDNVVAITGVTRLPATYSLVTARVFGTLNTLIPAATIFSVIGVAASRFVSLADATIHDGINEVQRFTFSAVPASGTWTIAFSGQSTSALTWNADNTAIAAALNALNNLSGVTVSGSYATAIDVEFAGADGEKDQVLCTSTNTLQDGSSNPITITITENVKGYLPHVDVLCRAELTGATAAASGTLTVIETPLYGMDTVTNLLDAIVGRNLETDAELRLRRMESLQRTGTATVNGIVSTLRALTGVDTVFVIENNTDLPDIDARPPHSYEAFVQGGDDDEILNAIWLTKPAGIRTVGNFSGSILDSQGFSQVLYFSRPSESLIYLDVTITKNIDPTELGGVYPATGDQLVRDAILAYGATFEIGQDVVLSRFFTPINVIPGIVGITIKAGLAPAPSGTSNLPIIYTSLAKFDASRLTVTSV